MKSLNEGIAAGSANSAAASPRPLAITARELMTTAGTVLRSDQTLADAIAVLIDRKESGVPVVDSDRKLVGVISEFDCIKAIIETSFHQDGKPGVRAIAELMNREVRSVGPDADVYTIAHLFIAHGIRRVPVVDQGELVGIVSRSDVLQGIRALVT